MAELLLDKGYKVYGLRRRTSIPMMENIEPIKNEIEFIEGDLLDQGSLMNAVRKSNPDEVYNLAAQSFVATSWEQPVLTGQATAIGVTNMLEAVRLTKPEARFYQASSSEMFGKVVETLKRKALHFIQEVLTELQRFMVTGLLLIIGKATTCMHVQGSCLIMNHLVVVLSLLLGK